jgi:drug/metabolite transporter (DMT)-like permease
MIYILILLNISLLVAGQLLWKYGISQTGFQLTTDNIIRILMNKYIIFGMITYIIATFLWLYILSKKDVTSVYPLQSLCYLIMLIAGGLIFKEVVTLNRWIGVLLIIAGAFLVNKG